MWMVEERTNWDHCDKPLLCRRNCKWCLHYLDGNVLVNKVSIRIHQCYRLSSHHRLTWQVSSISEDLMQGKLTSSSSSGRDGLLQLLDYRNVRVIPFGEWEKIDSEERRLGNLRNKPREKLATLEELRKVATE